MESTFPEGVKEIKVHFFKNGVETLSDTSDVVSGKWSFQTDITSWVSGDYEVKFFAHDQNGTVIDQIIITITVQSDIKEGKKPGSVFDEDFNNSYIKTTKSFTDKIKIIKKDIPENIKKINIQITKDGEIQEDLSIDVSKNEWTYEKDVTDWKPGTYYVALEAIDELDEVYDSTSFEVKIKEEEEKEPFANMPLFCAIMLIIFIILFIVFFVLTIIKHKKIMNELRFDPKTVVKKVPMMSYMGMLITLLLVLAGTATVVTAKLELIPFLLFIVFLGLLMLVTYWAFSNRNLPNFLFYLIMAILALIVISLAAVWSPIDAFGLTVGTGLVVTGFILLFISAFLYWLTSRRGFLIALVTVILALAFCIINIVFVVLSLIDFVNWWVTLVIGTVLLTIMLLISWNVLRDDIFYFETREESKTHRGYRRTFNMFDILSTPHGVLKRDYDRKVMGKISYEHMMDKNVRMEVIQLREWDTLRGKTQGRRLMGVYVKKMRSKEGPLFQKESVAKSVKYTTYSSDTNLDDKLKLCQAFGFAIQDSGKERGLEYYDLELVHKPFLGLGTPMGAGKIKKDYDKDSGYARDKDKEKDEDREHRYDYEHEEEKRKERRERESKAAYEKDRERDRRRYEEEHDEDAEDWSSKDRGEDRDRDRGRARRDRGRDDRPRDKRQREDDYEANRAPERWPPREKDDRRERPPARRREPEHDPEKPKKRPPPPKIVAD